MSRRPIQCDDKNIKDILDKYTTVLLDLDGVVWATDHYTALPGVGDALHKLRQMDKHLIFISNNCLEPRQQLQESIKRLAGYNAPMDDIFTSSRIAALYISHITKSAGKCYAIGNEALQAELDAAGVSYHGCSEDLGDDFSTDITSDLGKMNLDPNVKAVVVGWDMRYTFTKLTKAVNYLSKGEECLFIAATDDPSVNIGGRVLPMTSGIIGSISCTIHRRPVLVGKPSRVAFECLQAHYPALRPETTLMVGDIPDIDMKFAENAGMDSLMVLTGAGTLGDIEDMQARGETHVPNYIIASLGELSENL